MNRQTIKAGIAIGVAAVAAPVAPIDGASGAFEIPTTRPICHKQSAKRVVHDAIGDDHIPAGRELIEEHDSGPIALRLTGGRFVHPGSSNVEIVEREILDSDVAGFNHTDKNRRLAEGELGSILRIADDTVDQGGVAAISADYSTRAAINDNICLVIDINGASRGRPHARRQIGAWIKP